MTSEYENVMRAQIVAKTNDLKQIAVSTTNLTPDASGVAPLEKQGAFTQTQVQEPQITQTTVQENVPGVTPELEPQIQEPQMPAMDQLTAQMNNDMAADSLAPVENTSIPNVDNSGEVLENIDYKKPNADGILTDPVVDVVGTTGMDQMNFSALVDKPLEALNKLEVQEQPKEEEVTKMEMPVMEQEIKAQEPTIPDNRLFEGTSMETGQNLTNDNVIGDTPFSVPVENNVEPTVPNNVDLVNPVDTMKTTNEIPAVEPLDGTLNEQVSAFDDHLKMPEELAAKYSLPQDNMNLQENVLEQAVEPVQESSVSSPEVAPVPNELSSFEELPHVEETPSFEETPQINELPSIDEMDQKGENVSLEEVAPVTGIPTIEMPTIDTPSINNNDEVNVVGGINYDKLRNYLETIKETTSKLENEIDRISGKIVEPLVEEKTELSDVQNNIEIPVDIPVENQNIDLQPTEDVNTMVQEQPTVENPSNETLMNVDDEPVHGKFI